MQTTSVSQAVTGGDFWVAGKDCDLVARLKSDTLLVTFDNLASINERPTERPWPVWMQSRATESNYSVLGVQSHHKDWYRSAEAPDQIAELQAQGFFKRFQNIVFTGTSMGGFAALCFAGLVPGARVLAFSPQSTLNREIAPFERRYPYPYRKFDWQTPDYLDAAHYVGRISGGHVFYDPQVREDWLHAQRLQTPGLTQVPIPYAGHTLIRVLAKAGALDHLMTTYPGSGRVDADFFRLLRNKRANKAWAKPFLAAALARGNGPLAHRACKALHREHGHGFARRQLRQINAATK
ncbi:hypothetical protein [Phaeobacter porticola]|nr:hypothetical protein [Phaeobacter porticola]